MYSKKRYKKKMYKKNIYGKNRSVIISINKSATLFKCLKPPLIPEQKCQDVPNQKCQTEYGKKCQTQYRQQ